MMSAAKVPARMIPALVMTRPVRVRPRVTASWISWPASASSRMRLMMKML